jgi:hypothetical protein
MESSNPGAKDGASPRQQILEKEAIRKTTARIEIRILTETLEKKCSRENRQVINYKETSEKISSTIYLYRIDVLSYNC